MKIHSRFGALLFVTSLLAADARADEAHEFLYTAGHPTGQVWGFAINAATGALAPVPGDPYAFSGHPVAVAADPAGHFLFVTNEDGLLARYRINPVSGALVAVAGSPFSFETDFEGAAVSPSGQYFYVADPLNENVKAYRVGAKVTGFLHTSTTPVANNVNGVAVHPSGAFLYATTLSDGGSDFTGRVWAFAINAANGGLTPVPGSPYLEGPGTGTLNLAVHPSGRFVYAVNRAAGELTGYSIDTATGALTRLPSAPFQTGGSAPQFLAISASGRFLYATNTLSTDVSGFEIDQETGDLTALSGSPYATGSEPQGVALDSADRFVYVLSQGDNGVWAFEVDPDTGVLSPLAGSPFAGGGQGWDMIHVRVAQ